MKKTVEERFLSKIEKASSGCWLWTANKLPKGYGFFRMSNPRRQVLSHRASFELFRGPIPHGMLVCHSCDTPPCVNPDHLFVGLHSDNMFDAVNKGRWHGRNFNITHCKRGHEFTEENTRLNKLGGRICITCFRAYDNKWKKAKRVEITKEMNHG